MQHDRTLDAPLSRTSDVLGPARLLRRLGAGGFGTVFAAELVEDTSYGRAGDAVAVKILHADLVANPRAVARLRGEAQLGSRIKEPRVVTVHEAGESLSGVNPVHYLVMEFVEGRSLSDLLRAMGHVPEPLLRDLGRQVALGLAAIHAHGAVHRDVKPSNVVITPDHRVKLTDLGIARLVEGAARLTLTGDFAGSPEYAAPEQFGQAELTSSIDLYALGVLLHEAATGHHPFRADSPAQVMRRHLDEVPARASERMPALSPLLDELIAGLLEKDPARRPGSALEVARILAEGESSAWWVEHEALAARGVARRGLSRLHVGRDAPFVGRSEELAAIRAAWSEVVASRSGTVMVIDAEAGLGKTRLVDELVRGLETGADRPVPRMLYGSRGPNSAGGTLGAVGDALVAALGTLGLEAALAPHLEGRRDLAQALASALRPRSGEPACREMSAEAARAATLRVIASLASETPMLLVAEDLHFASAPARAVLLALANAAMDMPLLLLVTSRPGDPDLPLLTALPRAARMSLHRLSDSEVQQLVQAALGRCLIAPRVASHVALHCGGNPFLALQMLETLKSRGILARRPGGWWSLEGDLAEVEAPESLRSALLSRLATVPAESRLLLEAASVQGSEVEPVLVAAALGRDEFEVLEALAEVAMSTGLLRPAGSAFVFEHHVVQETLHRSLPARARAKHHLAVAHIEAARRSFDPGALSPVAGADALVLLRHYLRAGEADIALRLARPALEHAASGPGIAEVPSLVDDLSTLLGERAPAERARLLRAKAQVLKLMGVADERLVAAGEAASRIGAESADASLARELEATLAGYLAIAGRGDEAAGRARGVLESSRSAGDARAELLSLDVLADLATRRGDARTALELHHQALEVALASGDVRASASRHEHVAFALLHLGEPARALHHYRVQLRLAEQLADDAEAAAALDGVGQACARLGHHDEAASAHERALALAQRLNRSDLEGRVLNNLGLLLHDAGRLREARECHERRLRLARDMGRRDSEAVALTNLGEVAASESSGAEAESYFTASLEICRELGFSRVRAHAIDGLAGLAARREDGTEDALALHAEAVALCRELGLKALLGEALGSLGLTLLGAGRSDDARRVLSESLALRRESGGEAAGPREQAALAFIGVLDPTKVRVHEGARASERVTAHLLLHRAGAGEVHRVRARELLELMWSHMPERDTRIAARLAAGS